MPKSTYEYHHAKDPEYDRYLLEKRLIADIFENSRQTYGYRRIVLKLRRNEGICMSGKTVLKIMRMLGIRPLQRKNGKYNSYKKQGSPPEPNLLSRNFESEGVCEKLVSDVTEFKVAGMKVYLSPLIDLFNGEVIGHSVSTSPTVAFVTQMMDGMEERIPAGVNPIIHTDQGLQYWHGSYKKRLESLGARQSMSRKANCQDNAPAESFFGHLKTEFFYRSNFKTVPEFRVRLDEYIDWYNNERIRCDLGGLSPVEYREQYQAMQA